MNRLSHLRNYCSSSSRPSIIFAFSSIHLEASLLYQRSSKHCRSLSKLLRTLSNIPDTYSLSHSILIFDIFIFILVSFVCCVVSGTLSGLILLLDTDLFRCLFVSSYISKISRRGQGGRGRDRCVETAGQFREDVVGAVT
jgi:hypothetical protein